MPWTRYWPAQGFAGTSIILRDFDLGLAIQFMGENPSTAVAPFAWLMQSKPYQSQLSHVFSQLRGICPGLG